MTLLNVSNALHATVAARQVRGEILIDDGIKALSDEESFTSDYINSIDGEFKKSEHTGGSKIDYRSNNQPVSYQKTRNF